MTAQLEEPRLLPARLPNVLLNGTTGIAVGMATDIPPHNLREVVSALIFCWIIPMLRSKTFANTIPAPDFPTDAEIITPRNELLSMYKTGNGSLRMRAVYSVEMMTLLLLHYLIKCLAQKVLEQIAEQMQNKKLPLVSDLRDESDHENPTRLIIVPRSNRVDVEMLRLTYLQQQSLSAVTALI